MSTFISQLTEQLEKYGRGESSLGEIHDFVTLRFQEISDDDVRTDMNVASEILCFVYEIQDGATDEEEFRQWVERFLKAPVAYAERTPIIQRRRKRAILWERREMAYQRRRAARRAARKSNLVASSSA